MAQLEIANAVEVPLVESSKRSSSPPVTLVGTVDRGPIRDIVLDRRGARNALTLGMCHALALALREAAECDRVAVVVLGSSGGAFCAGSERYPSPTAGAEFAAAASDYALALAKFPKPIVAVVNGLAAGIGAATLLHCDFVVASEFAEIEFSSAKAALLPDAGASVLLSARVGQALASELLMFGGRLNPKTAERLGLVNGVVPMEDLARSGRARAEGLASLPHATVREAKRLLREPLLPALVAAIQRERDAAIVAAHAGGTAPPSLPLSR